MPLDHAGQRVLVVDDERHCTDLLRQLLTPDGFSVESAADGEAALIAINMKAPDLVLLDVGLPGINGIEVCRMIKQTQTTRLTTPRPYRLALSHASAIAELRREVTCGRMSRDLVEMFIAVLDGRQLDKIA